MKAIDQPLQPNRASPQATGLVAWYPALGQVGAGQWRDAMGTSHLALRGPAILVPDSLRHLAVRLGDAAGQGSGEATMDLAALLPGNALSVTAWALAWNADNAVDVENDDTEAAGGTIASVLVPPCFSLSCVEGSHVVWSLSVGGVWSSCRAGVVSGAHGLRHIAGTWDGMTQRLYVDGVERCRATPAGALDTAAGLLQVGAGCSQLLGELAIYDRALHPATIWQMAHPPSWWDLYTRSTLSRVALMSPDDPTYFTFVPIVEAGS